MRLRFLGTGTSFGVPVIGCDCETCTSDDSRDRRTRHAALLESDDGSDDGAHRLLVDTPPEVRLQLVREGIRAVDAVWFTHCHADHVHGIDDLRAFTARARTPLVAYAGSACARTLRHRFGYIFDDGRDLPDGTTRPELRLEAIGADGPVTWPGGELMPVTVPHGRHTVFGFRTGDLGYVTDAGDVPDEARERLRGVRVLVLNALWFGRRHPTHLTVEEAVDVSRSIGAERTFLTHLTHRVRHADLLDALPDDVRPAYDGLAVDL